MSLFTRILVPVDFSSYSRAALGAALEIADAFGASVEVTHVYNPPDYVSTELMVLAPSGKLSLGEHSRRHAEQELDKLIGEVGPERALNRRVVIGEPRREILSLAEKEGFDLIVMGTRGRMGRERMFAGSVAEAVVRNAPCPVLTVHSAE